MMNLMMMMKEKRCERSLSYVGGGVIVQIISEVLDRSLGSLEADGCTGTRKVAHAQAHGSDWMPVNQGGFILLSSVVAWRCYRACCRCRSPEGHGRSQDVIRFRVQGGSGRFREVQGGSGRFRVVQEVQGGSGRFREVQRGSGRFRVKGLIKMRRVGL